MMFNATFNTISVIPCYFTVLSSIINSLKKKCLDFVEEFKNLEDASSHYLTLDVIVSPKKKKVQKN